MATHSSILAWRIPWIEEPSGLQSMGWLDTTEPLSLSSFGVFNTDYLSQVSWTYMLCCFSNVYYMFNDAEVDKAEWNKEKQRYGCIKLFNHSISFCYGKGFQTFILENKQIYGCKITKAWAIINTYS